MTDTLGPFQAIWDAWDEVDAEIKAKPLEHFESAIEIQFKEMRSHLADNNRQGAAREAVDVISIALNILRRLDYQPADVAHIAEARGTHRMRTQTAEILKRYKDDFGI